MKRNEPGAQIKNRVWIITGRSRYHDFFAAFCTVVVVIPSHTQQPVKNSKAVGQKEEISIDQAFEEY
jgi:hypothetical protein